ncbi:MAG: hypothetical protein ACXWNI_07875, partial [Candidatus Limnocylindrales bacterium]
MRGLAATDPGAAWNRWRLTREKLYREHPSSPVLPDARGAFVARHFAYDPRLRFEAVVHSAEAPAPEASPALGAGLALPISVGRPISFDRVGWLDLPFESGVRRLAL